MSDTTTARARIERAMHVSFKLPGQVAELLDAYRDEVLTEAAELIRVSGDAWTGYVHAADAAALLLAARTTTAQES
jgi:hypothetical protein